jgi:hypothetical protein
MRKIFIILALSVAALLPFGSAYAQTQPGIVSCINPFGTNSPSTCDLCALVTTGQNIINFAIMVAMPIAAALIAWAGLLYFTSALNPGQIAKAHAIFRNTVIGLVGVLMAWLVVDMVIHQLIIANNSQYFSATGGSWNKVPPCTGARATNKLVKDLLYGVFAPGAPVTIQSVEPPAGAAPSCSGTSVVRGSGCYNETTKQFELPTNYSCANATFDSTTGGCKTSDGLTYVPLRTGGGTTVANGDIAAAAGAYQGTATNLGPDGGNLACAWAVNNVLTSAGIAPIDGNSVSGMESALQSGRGTSVSTPDAQAGDIIIWKDTSAGVSHVGICQTAGCTSAISNSSSKATFTNVSGPTFSGVPGRVYHVNK